MLLFHLLLYLRSLFFNFLFINLLPLLSLGRSLVIVTNTKLMTPLSKKNKTFNSKFSLWPLPFICSFCMADAFWSVQHATSSQEDKSLSHIFEDYQYVHFKGCSWSISTLWQMSFLNHNYFYFLWSLRFLKLKNWRKYLPKNPRFHVFLIL